MLSVLEMLDPKQLLWEVWKPTIDEHKLVLRRGMIADNFSSGCLVETCKEHKLDGARKVTLQKLFIILLWTLPLGRTMFLTHMLMEEQATVFTWTYKQA